MKRGGARSGIGSRSGKPKQRGGVTASGEPDAASLLARRDEIIKRLPVRAPIFLPTERIPLADQVAGLERVLRIVTVDLEEVYRPRLRALREKHAGQQRCFIIGNGPSLNRTNLHRLKGEVTFATNGFFLKTKELDWHPTYYVVEDHLVAEDRASWINAFEGPTKLFPANLAYCLDAGDDTAFFDLRPRKSYPHGFDFSTDASDRVYAGGTVTFSCMQLAYYFGFREIYLIGVDADYKIPDDAQIVGATGVSELDMKSDDPNYFHPDYFGKGFRWHDPNVDRMLAAYAEARRVADGSGQSRFFNATIGGKLEVFPRVSYSSLFERADRAAVPRTLLIDMTPFGGASATGELKRTYFDRFSGARLLHLHASGLHRLGLAPGETPAGGARARMPLPNTGAERGNPRLRAGCGPLPARGGQAKAARGGSQAHRRTRQALCPVADG